MAVSRLEAPPQQPHLRALRNQLGISRERMARLLDVSTRTVERLEEQDRLPADSGACARLALVQQIAELGLLVYTPAGFAQFVGAPLATFNGRTALQMIERGDGDQVLGALATDYEGAAT